METCPLRWVPLGYSNRSVWRSEPAHALSLVSLPSEETPSRSSCKVCKEKMISKNMEITLNANISHYDIAQIYSNVLWTFIRFSLFSKFLVTLPLPWVDDLWFVFVRLWILQWNQFIWLRFKTCKLIFKQSIIIPDHCSYSNTLKTLTLVLRTKTIINMNIYNRIETITEIMNQSLFPLNPFQNSFL